MAPARRKLDKLHTLPAEWSKPDSPTVQLARFNSSNSSHSILIGTDQEGSLHVDSGAEVPGCNKLFKATQQAHLLKSGTQHAHLLKSGPLGKCNNPYCVTCRGFYGYSASIPGHKAFPVADKKDHSKTPWWKRLFSPVILNPHSKLVYRWNQFFAISCLVATFIDPLFFFTFSVRQGYFCIVFDTNFATTITILRSLTDFIYFMHMLLQIMIWIIVPSITKNAKANYTKDILRATVLFQYIPRMIRFLPLLFGRSQSGFIFETAWINFIMNLFIYLLAGHVVGSCWYLFTFQRVNVCLRETCAQEMPSCSPSFLDCGNGKDIGSMFRDSNYSNWIQTSNSSSNCLAGPSFAYGIYASGVPVTLERNVMHKYVYALFWGLLQISTLGGNVVPDYFVWEVLFTITVIGLGLLLLALLIGNMQNFLQSLGRRQLEMQLRRYDVEAWMKRRGLPNTLRKRVRQAGRFNWAATRGVNEEELLNQLPEDLHKQIRRNLCFELVKKVHIFTVMAEEVLDAICERLHQRLYIQESQIFVTGGSVDRMVFIVRGHLETVGSDGSVTILHDGDFCGEELLIWSLQNAAIHASIRSRFSALKLSGKNAISSRTVRCLSSVEAFSLEADDLEYVTKHYSRIMRSPRVQGAIRYQSSYYRSWAAGRIQAAWRYQKRKKAETFHLQHSVSFEDIPMTTLGHTISQNTLMPALGHTRSQNHMR
ncbi:hypothetical protein O6H91_02G123300 [Diphasiastrum complanatum]|uniref:Uncharacterized protein n=1 Tax=Diphasiastrum complanatum TaxID=34168 RepID=A0ACC2EKH2_DIPCM|nr:hypothetical protein O6H91_02G123300 [Diphasiastrum complanatum]